MVGGGAGLSEHEGGPKSRPSAANGLATTTTTTEEASSLFVAQSVDRQATIERKYDAGVTPDMTPPMHYTGYYYNPDVQNYMSASISGSATGNGYGYGASGSSSGGGGGAADRYYPITNPLLAARAERGSNPNPNPFHMQQQQQEWASSDDVNSSALYDVGLSDAESSWQPIGQDARTWLERQKDVPDRSQWPLSSNKETVKLPGFLKGVHGKEKDHGPHFAFLASLSESVDPKHRTKDYHVTARQMDGMTFAQAQEMERRMLFWFEPVFPKGKPNAINITHADGTPFNPHIISRR